jgi:hypothetical protein
MLGIEVAGKALLPRSAKLPISSRSRAHISRVKKKSLHFISKRYLVAGLKASGVITPAQIDAK